MNTDPIEQFKSRQRETWTRRNFADMAVFTTPVAGHLKRYARVTNGHAVLDAGTGTGVVAITARNIGAKLTGLDLTPALSAHARKLPWWPAMTIIRVVQARQQDPERLESWRNETEKMPGEYLHYNVVRNEHLLTRATKVWQQRRPLFRTEHGQ